MASRAKATMLEPIWHGVLTTTAGGAKVKLSSIWMETINSQQYAEPAQKTISADLTTLMLAKKMEAIENSQHPMLVFLKF